jgi:nickel superoxide dismutase
MYYRKSYAKQAMNGKNILFIISKVLPAKIAYAHCDIPCGIYDPNRAQLAAHTVIRMTQLLSELVRDDKTKLGHDIARMTSVKEKHAEIIEEELGTLEDDYFKEEHFKEFSELKELFSNSSKLTAKIRQNIDMKAAEEMLENILKISEIFYKTKKLQPVRIKSPYPTQREIVTYK